MKLVRPLIVMLAVGVLAGCAAEYVPKAEPSFYRNLAAAGRASSTPPPPPR